MNRRVVNLLLSLLSVVLAVGLFGFGVYSAKTATSTIDSSFKFVVSEEDVFVDIVGSVSGCKNENDIRQYKHEWNNCEEFAPWNVSEDLKFNVNDDDSVENIVFTFDLKNYTTNQVRFSFLEVSQSDKILQTPSDSLTLNPYQFVDDEENAPSGQMLMTISLKEPRQDFSALAISFTLQIDVINN